MAPDDAVDVIGEIDDERREAVLAMLPVSQRIKVRTLLGYDPAEAGGLMSPEFVSLRRTTSASEALEAVRSSKIEPEVLTAVFVNSPEGELDGSVSITTLVRAEPRQPLSELVKHDLPTLRPDAPFEEVARLMADYNLTCVPVVDADEQMVGVVTVDDVLEAMLPRGWRRRFGLLGED